MQTHTYTQTQTQTPTYTYTYTKGRSVQLKLLKRESVGLSNVGKLGQSTNSCLSNWNREWERTCERAHACNAHSHIKTHLYAADWVSVHELLTSRSLPGIAKSICMYVCVCLWHVNKARALLLLLLLLHCRTTAQRPSDPLRVTAFNFVQPTTKAANGEWRIRLRFQFRIRNSLLAVGRLSRVFVVAPRACLASSPSSSSPSSALGPAAAAAAGLSTRSVVPRLGPRSRQPRRVAQQQII